ncbi:hypothetical protein BDY17DRAFT_85389 [Neohortaea acidophila]|uniref:Uncharacterized protein n=1 Tax=Neohortaea acidophila TaxID=245834 RepID=A0A6A6Q2K2_9PEZI|nr:uncharacterized protein BDY17DRAFT_85389 [Neohortaea acidophila]KAF2486758.1 hypothetical protein BDY17DRAFT_85389 [Neohortaea acidophila]
MASGIGGQADLGLPSAFHTACSPGPYRCHTHQQSKAVGCLGSFHALPLGMAHYWSLAHFASPFRPPIAHLRGNFSIRPNHDRNWRRVSSYTWASACGEHKSEGGVSWANRIHIFADRLDIVFRQVCTPNRPFTSHRSLPFTHLLPLSTSLP